MSVFSVRHLDDLFSCFVKATRLVRFVMTTQSDCQG